jgi:hypothetical protein
MTVKEIQALAPKAEVYELAADQRYMVVVDECLVSHEACKRLYDYLRDQGLHVLFVVGNPHAFKFMEFSE